MYGQAEHNLVMPNHNKQGLAVRCYNLPSNVRNFATCPTAARNEREAWSAFFSCMPEVSSPIVNTKLMKGPLRVSTYIQRQVSVLHSCSLFIMGASEVLHWHFWTSLGKSHLFVNVGHILLSLDCIA